ncbi:MAG: hypothetical protein FWH20_04490 [Oscillospiraceae bacterium]|nr:hypothetical protein [Oscillospiraceae bacterium]
MKKLRCIKPEFFIIFGIIFSTNIPLSLITTVVYWALPEFMHALAASVVLRTVTGILWKPLVNAAILTVLAFLIMPSRIIRVATAIYAAVAVIFTVLVFLYAREIFIPSENIASVAVLVLMVASIGLFWAYVRAYSRVSYPTALRVNAVLNTIGLLFWGLAAFWVYDSDERYIFLYFFTMSAFSIAFLIFYVALLKSRGYLREFDKKERDSSSIIT